MSAGGPCIFGEVLFDRFPDGARVLGGAPFNVAWHLQAFGARPRLVSRVGDDDAGAQVRSAMRDWGMDLDSLQIDPRLPTGQVTVTFNNGEPSYDIVRPSAWDAIERAGELRCELLYHGTLAARDPRSKAALGALVKQHDGVIFVDVNLRPPWWDGATLESMLEAADWAKLNEDELRQLGGEQADAQSLLQHFSLDGVILTRGAAGAELTTASGTSASVAPEPVGEVVDTVGAGDAFTSVVLLGLLNAWPEALTLERAQAFASGIVRQRGATVSDPDFYRTTMANWRASA